MGLFYGSIFYKISDGSVSSDYTNRLSLMFFCLMFMVLGHQQAIPSLFEDRLVFYRERGARAYGAIPYWFSSWFIQLPLIFINVMIFSAIVYSMAGFTSAPGSFGVFFGTLYMSSVTGLFMAPFIASLAPSAQAAISFFPVALFFSVAFAGYIVYIPEFDRWIRCWAPYLSFMRWGFQAMVINEFQDNGSLPQGQEYINNLGFNTFTKQHCLSMIPCFTMFFSSALLVCLRHINFEER